MTSKIGWYIEGKIPYIQYGRETNAHEVLEPLDKSNAYIRQTQRSLIHEIIDLTRWSSRSVGWKLPKRCGALPDLRIGWTITVGEQDKLVRFTTSVAR